MPHSNDPTTTRAAPALVPPTTPQHPKSGAALDQLLRKLEDEWQLDLEVGGQQTPAKMRTTAGKAKQKIQYLFYSSMPVLHGVLRRFKEDVPRRRNISRLELLDSLLREEVSAQSPRSGTATPVSTRNQPPKSLLSTPHSSQFRDRLHGRETGYDEAETHIPAVDPGSPTNVDTDDEIAAERLASPSPSFRSSNRRLKGKQPAGPPAAAPVKTPDTLKKPVLNRTRFFPPPAQSFSSVNTSFSDIANSSQETMATSVNTSFASSKAAGGQMKLHDEIHKATLGSAELKDELEALGRTSSQAMSRGSNSTYGSVDEDVLLKEARQLEQEIKFIGLVTGPSTSAHNPAAEPRTTTHSPSKLSYQVREIPKKNLFVEPLPVQFLEIPFFLLFICCRLSSVARKPIGDLLAQLQDEAVQTSAIKFWTALGAQFHSGPVESNAVWKAARQSFEGFTFKGRVSFSPISAPGVFQLELSPIEAEKSCQLQRMFGSDRFLYLTFPSFSENRPQHIVHAEMSSIKEQWKMWLMQEHSFLGRKWRVFHVEPIKRKKTQRPDESSDVRVILFAIQGHGISRISVGEMLNSFMPLDKNQNQNYCKAYARLDLALSRTMPTLIFKPSEIRRIADKWSDGTPESTEFNDTTLDWSESCGPQVMNDGCARISVGAALKVWDIYQNTTGSDEPFPSAFQGRIRGAKGMWMVSAEAHTRDQAHLDVWIEISDSQSKFEPAQNDEHDTTYNKHRLTFNLVQHSFVNGSTDLHISFIPALVERGVEKTVIADLMNKHMDMERKHLLEMLTEPVQLHNWVSKQGSAASVNGILQWQAALPIATTEKVKLLLRAGFTPRESPYLAKVLIKFVNQLQATVEQKLRAPLGSATYLYGLADPEAVLQPGEVHISFSSPFIDDYSRQTYRHLDGLEVLVARQPACRRSDVQKLRAIAHPKLAHLTDVIVFPVRGEYPLAGKLQGGDYDGDTFWICWDNILVEPFRNAPAPLNPPNHADSGIEKDDKALKQVMDTRDLSSIDGFLKEAFDFRLTSSLLGMATNLHEKVAYNQNKITSHEIDALCDLHDLLVDAPKQAYKFDEKKFHWLVGHKLKLKDQHEPAYKQAMKSRNNREIGTNDKMTPGDYNYNPDNILDYLYFDVIRKHNFVTRQLVSDALPKEQEDDPILQQPYVQLKGSKNKALEMELQTLLSGFGGIVKNWNCSLGDRSESTIDRYGRLLDRCYASFCSLNPSSATISDPEIARLIDPRYSLGRPPLWETIRASAFYTEYPKKHTLVWQMAGRELSMLKAYSNPDTYHVVPAIFADMKAKPHKVPRLDEDESDDELESDPERIV